MPIFPKSQPNCQNVQQTQNIFRSLELGEKRRKKIVGVGWFKQLYQDNPMSTMTYPAIVVIVGALTNTQPSLNNLLSPEPFIAHHDYSGDHLLAPRPMSQEFGSWAKHHYKQETGKMVEDATFKSYCEVVFSIVQLTPNSLFSVFFN